MQADLEGIFLNCFVGGEVGSTLPDGSWVRNKIEFEFGGYEMTLIQELWVLKAKISEYRKQSVETTRVIVPNVSDSERTRALSLLESLSFLLSFATTSDVAFYGFDHMTEQPRRERCAVVASTGYYRPPFDIRSGKSIRMYLEQTGAEFLRLEEARALKVAVHILTLAETRSLPLELRLATLFILLENLKSTYAKERGYRFVRGHYVNEANERLGFKVLLTEMFERIGMSGLELSAIVDLRNDIIHSGLSETSYEDQEEIYNKSQDLTREYFLRLLKYKGKFRPYSGHGMSVKSIE